MAAEDIIIKWKHGSVINNRPGSNQYALLANNNCKKLWYKEKWREIETRSGGQTLFIVRAVLLYLRGDAGIGSLLAVMTPGICRWRWCMFAHAEARDGRPNAHEMRDEIST